ncbi:SPV124 hypothetical protein [Swinepox virus]|uniref:Uncharacterized protein n=1 Tax=Swinepox virus (strain Swine/Nebraska/17077-99/1999) TaxID=300880 RepID=Q8V3H2_SWPV1|nr:hypothetical protein SWPVgp124 [Swinepox virus]AAL69863.1 SPV124 hypothetical protein [Swinepox virus]UED36602.1 hypothetical protein SPVwb_123 [Swinepox virus]UED36751.1 hypothetical protein SPVdp_125 [Swinepox virus]UUA44314.1 SPV124 [Swinepox virus]
MNIEKTKVFKMIPFFNGMKIKNRVLELANMNVTNYYDSNHSDIILSEIEHCINEKIYTSNMITIKHYDQHTIRKKTIESVSCNSVKAFVCIQSAKKGGMLIVFNKITKYKRIIHPNTNCIVLLNSLAEYSISNVNRGTVTIITLDIDIPSMRIIDKKIKNIHYSNSLTLLNPIKCNEIVFVIKQLLDIHSLSVICEQILINNEWYMIIRCGTNKFYLPSVCLGKILLNFNYVYDNFDKEKIAAIINNNTPFDLIYPQKSIYRTSIVYEKILYGKICINSI